MTFWLLAALLTAVVVGGLLPPLIGLTRARCTRPDLALAVYKAQLQELARDRDRGVLSPAEAAALETEIERRMLNTAEAEPALESSPPSRGRLAVTLVAAVLLPISALLLYLTLGRPELQGQPHFGLRPLAGEAPTTQDPELARLVGELEARMAERPGDAVGWRLLGHAREGLGRFSAAADAYARAVKAGGGDAETLAAWGEALVFASEGQVTNESNELFIRALKADPKEPRARYYQGLAKLQGGDPSAAAALWRGLAADAPKDASWAPFVAERIRLAEAMAAQSGSAPAQTDAGAPGPGPEDLAAAETMTPAERQTFIRGMVDRLAARLEREPNDLQGWLRLAHAYEVLNEPARRRDALAHAVALAPQRADLQMMMAEAETASGEPAAAARRLRALLDTLPQGAPERDLTKTRLEALQPTLQDMD